MSPFPQAGELWCFKRNPAILVLVSRVTESKELVFTKNLFRDGGEGYRGMNTFRTVWKPVTQDTQ